MLEAEKINQRIRVFEQIHALSAKERKAFLTFLGPDRKGRNYKKLTSSIIRLKSVEELEGLGWKPTVLKNACSYILIKLIEFLARERQSANYRLAEIRLAIEFGVFGHARKMLLEGLEIAYQDESLGLAWEFYELEKRLREKHGFEVIRDGEFLDYASFQREFELMFRARKMRRQIRNLVQEEPGKRIQNFEKLALEVDDLESDFRLARPSLEALKAIRGLYILGREFGMVAKKQLAIIKLMEQKSFLWRGGELIEERLNMVTYYLAINSPLEATQLLEKLEEEINDLPNVKGGLIGGWVRQAIIVGASLPKIGMGDRLEELLLKHNNRIQGRFKLKLYHALSVVFMYERKWEKVISWQNRIARSQKSISQELSWVPSLMKCIAYLEMADFDNAGSQLDGLFSAARKLENEFIYLNYSIVEELVECKLFVPSNSTSLESWRSKLSLLGAKEENRVYARYINISSWLSSIEFQKSISEIVIRNGGVKLFSLAS